MKTTTLKKDKNLSDELVCRHCGADQLVERFSLKVKVNGRQKYYCRKCHKEDFAVVKKEKRKRNPRDWAAYNAQLKRRGDFDLYISLEDWKTALAKMNQSKNGHPFVYPKLLIIVAMSFRFTHNTRYRQLEGFLEGLVSRFGAFPGVPDYSQLCRRINADMLDAKNRLSIKALSKWKEGDDLIIDSTGIKVGNRGEWIRHKHQVRRGWLKLHVAVNSKGDVVIAEVTEEETGDAEVFDNAVAPLLPEMKPRRVKGDGAYDKGSVFDAIDAVGADPVIPPKDGATTDCKSKPRRKVVREIIKDGYQEWKKKHAFGRRWGVESYNSAFKGTFGEHVMSHKPENMDNELYTKIMILQNRREM